VRKAAHAHGSPHAQQLRLYLRHTYIHQHQQQHQLHVTDSEAASLVLHVLHIPSSFCSLPLLSYFCTTLYATCTPTFNSLLLLTKTIPTPAWPSQFTKLFTYFLKKKIISINISRLFIAPLIYAYVCKDGWVNELFYSLTFDDDVNLF